VGTLMSFVEKTEKLARVRFFLKRDRRWPLQIPNFLMCGHDNRLMFRREKSVAPIRFAIRRLTANVRNGNISGQVVVFTAQGITDPSPSTGKAFLGTSRVHENAPRAMRVGFRFHRVDKRHVIDVSSHVR